MSEGFLIFKVFEANQMRANYAVMRYGNPGREPFETFDHVDELAHHLRTLRDTKAHGIYLVSERPFFLKSEGGVTYLAKTLGENEQDVLLAFFLQNQPEDAA